jgi:hypothetical protein
VADKVTTSKNPIFPGFLEFRSNVTFVPIQFFTVVIPHSPVSVVRIVGYVLRKLLGWVDEHGNPTREQVRFTWRELIESAGVSRDLIEQALAEAIKRHFICCLKAPQADRPGQPAISGTYELCWDKEGSYTDSPVEFRGFYYREAAVVPVRQAGRVQALPKAARKNIPNAFFDFLLPRERLAVIRVVGALLFYSIKWGPGGERRMPVSLSITELSRLTGRSRQHVHAALLEAQERGYIERVTAGCFDPAAGIESRPATYGVRWVSELSHPTTAPQPIHLPAQIAEPIEADRSKKVNGEAVQKGERDQSKKVNGDRLEKVNDISIKTESKTSKTTTVDNEPPTAPSSDSTRVAAAVELLVKTGFTAACAQHLAGKRPLEVIQRQLAWFPLRHCSRNRLGMLRSAIEFDWSKPEGRGHTNAEPTDTRLGKLFAIHYYAGYHGQAGAPTADPFEKDLTPSTKFVERLMAFAGGEDQVPDWGRRFGRLVRQHHGDDARAKPYLAAALTLYGDALFRILKQEVTARQARGLSRAKEAHQAVFWPAYLCYLEAIEKTLQTACPALYVAFLERRREVRRHMGNGAWAIPASVVERFDSTPARLADLADFFQKDPQQPVLDFWQWDKRMNPSRFGPAPAAAPTPEAHP